MDVNKGDFIAGYICAGGDSEEARRLADQFASCVEAAHRLSPPPEGEPEDECPVCDGTGPKQGVVINGADTHCPSCGKRWFNPFATHPKDDAHPTPEQSESEYESHHTLFHFPREDQLVTEPEQTGDALASLERVSAASLSHLLPRDSDDTQANLYAISILRRHLTASGGPERVLFQSDASGLHYRYPGAAGTIRSIVVNGERYSDFSSGVPYVPEEIRTLPGKWRQWAQEIGAVSPASCADELERRFRLAAAPAVPEYQFIGYAEHSIHQTPGPGDAIIDSDESSDYVSECVTPLYIEAALTDGRE